MIIPLISNSVSSPGIDQNQGGEGTSRGRPKPSKGTYVPMTGRLEVSQVTQEMTLSGRGLCTCVWPKSLSSITPVDKVRKSKSATNPSPVTDPRPRKLSAGFEGETQSLY